MIGEASLLTDQLCHVWWQMWPSVVMNGSLCDPDCENFFVFHLLLHAVHSVKRETVKFSPSCSRCACFKTSRPDFETVCMGW